MSAKSRQRARRQARARAAVKPMVRYALPGSNGTAAPIGERAIDQPGVRFSLLRRIGGGLARCGVGLAVAAPFGVVSDIWPKPPWWGDLIVFAGLLTGAVITAGGLYRLMSTARGWIAMTRHPWTVYQCLLPGRPSDGLLLLTLCDDNDEFTVLIPESERNQAFWQMTGSDVWFVGTPGRRGILTPAGGPELFRTRPARGYRLAVPGWSSTAAKRRRTAVKAARRQAVTRTSQAYQPLAPPTWLQRRKRGLFARLRIGRRVNWMK